MGIILDVLRNSDKVLRTRPTVEEILSNIQEERSVENIARCARDIARAWELVEIETNYLFGARTVETSIRLNARQAAIPFGFIRPRIDTVEVTNITEGQVRPAPGADIMVDRVRLLWPDGTSRDFWDEGYYYCRGVIGTSAQEQAVEAVVRIVSFWFDVPAAVGHSSTFERAGVRELLREFETFRLV